MKTIARPFLLLGASVPLGAFFLAACSDDSGAPSAGLDRISDGMTAIEGRLSADGASTPLCMDYIGLCEQGLALCLQSDNASKYSDFCGSLRGRCASTVSKYCSAVTDARSISTFDGSTNGGPIISSVSAAGITSTSASITWSLDAPATGQVEYGTTASYGLSSIKESSFSYSAHKQSITNLNPGALYHYRVRSMNQAGIESVSSDFTFTTTGTSTISSGHVYGSAIAGDSLNNTQVGGRFSTKVSYRFRATTTSALNAMVIYIVGRTHPGYGAGTGGTMRMTVQGDDGSSAHQPNGTVLASTDMNMFSVDSAKVNVTWPSPASLVGGNLYHVVFENIDASPTSNYVSLDGLYNFEAYNPYQKRFSNTDWAQLEKDGSAAWDETRSGGNDIITPIASFIYANGITHGMGYMESWGTSANKWRTVDGTRRIRETFSPSATVDVSKAWVRLARSSGSANLTVRLEKADGTLIEEGSIASSAIPAATKGGGAPNPQHGAGQGWVSYTFSQKRSLPPGSYNLVLSTSAGTEYWMTFIRKGVSYGYAATTYFNEGLAQEFDGATWGNAFNEWSSSRSNEADMQFALE